MVIKYKMGASEMCVRACVRAGHVHVGVGVHGGECVCVGVNVCWGW